MSQSAIEKARAFEDQVRRTPAAANTVVTFDWAYARTLRRGPDAPIENLGPGLDLVTQERPSVPDEFIRRDRGLEFAIHIPPWIYESSRERLIDVDPTTSRLVLR